MDSVARIGIPIVGSIYLISLGFFMRKIIISKREGKEIDRKLITLFFASGLALIVLVVAYILAL